MHKCLKCGKKFEKLTKEMLRGCPECGGNFFLYLKDGDSAAELVDKIKIEEKEPSEGERIESLRILSPGVYELNLGALLQRKGIIMEIKEDGSYAIHLPSLFGEKKQKHRWF